MGWWIWMCWGKWLTKSLNEVFDNPKPSAMSEKNFADIFLDQIRAVVREEIAAALNGNSRAADEPDRWLTPEEAAKLMQVNEAWIYRNSRRLPFAKKISRKQLRLSEKGLMRWLAARKERVEFFSCCDNMR